MGGRAQVVRRREPEALELAVSLGPAGKRARAVKREPAATERAGRRVPAESPVPEALQVVRTPGLIRGPTLAAGRGAAGVAAAALAAALAVALVAEAVQVAAVVAGVLEPVEA